MSRTFFLSPDPKPNRAFEATFIIEGLDDQGEPFAVVGDKYLMISLVEGSIIFERHLLEIESVDKEANHRAVLKFTSRDGFNAAGAFPLAVEKSDDPTTREEITVNVTATTTVAETKSAVIPLSVSTLTVLPVLETTDPVPKPDIPLTGAIPPITATKATVAPDLTMPPVVITTPPSKQSHPLRVASIILVGVAICAAALHFGKRSQAAATRPKAQSSAPAANNTPDVLSNTDTSNVPEVTTPPPEKQNIAPPMEQPVIPPQAPAAPTEPAPIPKCGACP